LLETPAWRWLWLSCVDGRDEQGLLGSGRDEQARRMFARARAALEALGFHYRHVVRTWIALRAILDWYGAFNVVRSSFHAEQGIGLAGTGAMAPASTGVEGASDGEHCVMDLLAVEPRSPECSVELIATSGVQGDARAYGSSFSRAARLQGSAGELLLVSGTASIGLDGQSLHSGDADAQARHTLRAVGALLEAEGASPADIVSGTLYVTDPAVLAPFKRAAAALRAPSLPVVSVLADLCRRELAVELDAIASVRRRARARA
jgi:enamine deaminase RidA (YjgF/YER057c/UK114 family)